MFKTPSIVMENSCEIRFKHRWLKFIVRFRNHLFFLLSPRGLGE